MNQLNAMKETLALAEAAGMDTVSSDNLELDFPHLLQLCNEAHDGAFDEAEIGRRLGWIQAAVVASDVGISHSQLVDINCKWGA